MGVTVSISCLQELHDVFTASDHKDDAMISSYNSSINSHEDDNGEDGPDPAIKSKKGVFLPNACANAMAFIDN